MYADEYGSLTSDADWAAKEMFKAALRERLNLGERAPHETTAS